MRPPVFVAPLLRQHSAEPCTPTHTIVAQPPGGRPEGTAHTTIFGLLRACDTVGDLLSGCCMVSKGVCRIVHVRHFAVCSPTVDGGTTARGSDDGDQCQRGPFPPGPHADGSAVVSDVSLALPPWRSTDDRVRRATRPCDHLARGRAGQSPVGRGVASSHAADGGVQGVCSHTGYPHW